MHALFHTSGVSGPQRSLWLFGSSTYTVVGNVFCTLIYPRTAIHWETWVWSTEPVWMIIYFLAHFLWSTEVLTKLVNNWMTPRFHFPFNETVLGLNSGRFFPVDLSVLLDDTAEDRNFGPEIDGEKTYDPKYLPVILDRPCLRCPTFMRTKFVSTRHVGFVNTDIFFFTHVTPELLLDGTNLGQHELCFGSWTKNWKRGEIEALENEVFLWPGGAGGRSQNVIAHCNEITILKYRKDASFCKQKANKEKHANEMFLKQFHFSLLLLTVQSTERDFSTWGVVCNRKTRDLLHCWKHCLALSQSPHLVSADPGFTVLFTVGKVTSKTFSCISGHMGLCADLWIREAPCWP